MKISIFGFDETLNIEKGEVGILNIQNRQLFGHIPFQIKDSISNKDNLIIIYDENNKRIAENEILFIPSILTYQISAKVVIDRLSRQLSQDINSDNDEIVRINSLYNKIIQPLIEKMNLLDIEYDYKEHLDYPSIIKLASIDLSYYDSVLAEEKIEALIKIYKTYWNVSNFIFFQSYNLLSYNEVENIKEFARVYDISIVFVENLDNIGVVTEKCLCIDESYTSFIVNND